MPGFSEMTFKEVLTAKTNFEIELAKMIRERTQAFEQHTGTKVMEMVVGIEVNKTLSGVNFIMKGVETKLFCPTSGGEFVTLS